MAKIGFETLDVLVVDPSPHLTTLVVSMLRHLKLPPTVKIARTITHYGNNSAASIPMALDAMLASGEASSGDTALIIGFGAGLVYAGQVVQLP